MIDVTLLWGASKAVNVYHMDPVNEYIRADKKLSPLTSGGSYG